MKKQLLFILCLSVASIFRVNAQVPLDSFIGMDHLPADTDPICDILTYPEVSSDLEGPFEGTLVHDFKLYTMDGDSVQLSGLLNDRKPVLLISCSYTCYVFRGKIDVINNVIDGYGDRVKVYLVYTVEAHPVVDVSPYFGVETVGAQNYTDGVLYRQPTTYGERKDMITEMLDHETINAPILIDGPCNYWWENFGTAPNCAFLIDPDGYVYDAQNWFQKDPEDIYATMDALLDSVDAGSFVPEGSFTAEDEGEPVYYGTVGNTITAHVDLTNTSATDAVLIDFLRTDVSIPGEWTSSLCTDLCFSPDEDSTSVYLLPGATEEVMVDFFTDDYTIGSGTVSVTFRNRYDESNSYNYVFLAQTVAEVAVETIPAENMNLYPNPAEGAQSVHLQYAPLNGDAAWSLMDISGRKISNGTIASNGTTALETDGLPAGIYMIHITDGAKTGATELQIAE